MARSISRRDFIRSTVAAALGGAVAATPAVSLDASFDLVIRGGTVLDGTGMPPLRADIGIRGDTIAAIGEIDPGRAAGVINASGMHVCPGFIDIHTHSDGIITAFPTADSRVHQGITTELTGNCGGSCAPLGGPEADEIRAALKSEDDIDADWSDVAGYFARLEQDGISINQALLLGQGTLRRNVAEMANRPLTPDELKQVLRAVEQGLEQGALGFSTGLEYLPGSYTPTDELVAIARVVARRGGLYASHIRNEADGLLEAVAEALEIGRQAGVRVEVSHLKAAGRPNWDLQGPALEMLEAARAEGVNVLADAYPYPAYSTGLTILLPAWAREGGHKALVARLNDKSSRKKIAAEVKRIVAGDPGGYELITISSLQSDRNKPLVGRNVLEIAGRWSVEPSEAMLRLLVEEEGRVQMIGHAMKPENVEMVLAHPLVMVGSDGHCMAPVGKVAETRPHPRNYGTCARVLGHYTRELKIFDLPTAVRKMTSMPAEQIGITDRGRIARGMKADIVVFDAADVADLATFSDPHQYPAGIDQVLVGGVPVVSAGEHTGARPGRVIRKV